MYSEGAVRVDSSLRSRREKRCGREGIGPEQKGIWRKSWQIPGGAFHTKDFVRI